MASKNDSKRDSVGSARQSLVAFGAGYAAFFIVTISSFGCSYFLVTYMLPEPTSWVSLAVTMRLVIGAVFSVMVGAVISGYVTARIAECAEFLHAGAVVALLFVTHEGIILAFPYAKHFDVFGIYGSILPVTLGVCPFFALGAWRGSFRRGRGPRRG